MAEFVKDFVVGRPGNREPLVCHVCGVRQTSRVKLESHYSAHAIQLKWHCLTCSRLEPSSQVMCSHSTKCRRKFERAQAALERSPPVDASEPVVSLLGAAANSTSAELSIVSPSGASLEADRIGAGPEFLLDSLSDRPDLPSTSGGVEFMSAGCRT